MEIKAVIPNADKKCKGECRTSAKTEAAQQQREKIK